MKKIFLIERILFSNIIRNNKHMCQKIFVTAIPELLNQVAASDYY